MRVVDNLGCKDPAVNLALEEFLLRHCRGEEAVLLLYVNDPAVVIGRNQVPYAEMGLKEVQRRQAVGMRRISGGGAVYHAPGNLNFSLIQTRRGDPFPSPSEGARPVRDALRSLGVPARLNDRHDILIGDMKITGTAQYRTQDRCLTHGTLLVSADLDALERVLTPDCQVSACRGRRSIRSKVTNVVRHAPGVTDTVLRRLLVEAFAEVHGPAVPLAPTARDWSSVHREAQSKYRSWEWSVGRSPAFTIHRRAGFPWGTCSAAIKIRRGIVDRVDLTLPAGAPSVVARWVSCLEGTPYHPWNIACRLSAAETVRCREIGSSELGEWLCPAWFWWH